MELESVSFSEEVWRQIPFPYGLFEASSLGRIRRLCDGFVMSPSSGADGYCRIPMRLVTGGKKTVYVHRLVAATFCPGDQTQTVNHINMVKHDNRASNLEWVTFSENHKRAWAMRPEWRNRPKPCKPVVATDISTGDETRYESGKVAAIAIGGANRAGNISHAIQMGNVAYGRKWRLAD